MERNKAKKNGIVEVTQPLGEAVVTRFKRARHRYFFKEWRKFRNLTQEQLGARMEMTGSSISQLENGKQGFSDSTLEAMAEALACHPGDLLMRNPLDTEAPWSIWDRLGPTQRKQALAVLHALASTGTHG